MNREQNKIIKFSPEDSSVADFIDSIFIDHISVVGESFSLENVVIAGGKILSLLMGVHYETFESKDWDVYLVDKEKMGFSRSDRVCEILKLTESYYECEDPEKKKEIAYKIWQFASKPDETFEAKQKLELCSMYSKFLRREVLNRLAQEGKIEISFAHPGSVAFTKLPYSKDKFELIELVDRVSNSVHELLYSFDLNVSRCAYVPIERQFYIDETLLDFLSGEDRPPVIEVWSMTKPLRTLNRIAKYHKRGFPIDPDAFLFFVREILRKDKLELMESDLAFFEQYGFTGSGLCTLGSV